MSLFMSESCPPVGRVPALVPLRELVEQLSAEIGRLEVQVVWEKEPNPADSVSVVEQPPPSILTFRSQGESIDGRSPALVPVEIPDSPLPRQVTSEALTDPTVSFDLGESVDSKSGFRSPLRSIAERENSRDTKSSIKTSHRVSCKSLSAGESTCETNQSWMLQAIKRHQVKEDFWPELAIWFEGITTPDCRALSPESLESFFLAAAWQAPDLDWISNVVCELRSRTEEMQAATVPTTKGRRISGTSTASSAGSHQSAWVARFGFRQEHPVDYLTFDDFLYLMQWTNLQDILEPEEANRIIQIREVLIRQCVERMILRFSGLKPAGQLPKRSFWVSLLEPLVGLVVCINAVTLGMSSDLKWSGWGALEIAFTLFYCCEFVLKMCIYGVHEHFTGSDRVWNCFDLAIVGLALIDIAVTEFASIESELNNFTMIRIARLARITRLMRLIRLLRLHFFKELLLMVKGVVAGMRTIAWACVLLATMIYMISVGLRQTVGEDALVVGQDQVVLFHSVGWSMFTVFRCFTTDCTLTDGTALLGYLYDHYGYKFVLPYALCTLFVMFGIFNLIMAVFVENVTESARQKRQLTRDDERARVVRKLRQLILKVGESSGERDPFPRASAPFHRRILSQSSQILRLSENKEVNKPSSLFFQHGGQITREMFNEVIDRKDINDILDDLEVHIGDRTELFDVIDADRTGTVDVSELINGLLKLRSGGADKSDMVAVILAIRSIQKQVATLLENSEEMQDAIETLQQEEERREEQNGCCSSRRVSL